MGAVKLPAAEQQDGLGSRIEAHDTELGYKLDVFLNRRTLTAMTQNQADELRAGVQLITYALGGAPAEAGA